MPNKRAMGMAVVGLAALVGNLAAQVAPAAAQGRMVPVSRPELALSPRDLPPGYEESGSLQFSLAQTPLEDRLMRRTAGTRGPLVVWSVTFEMPEPATAADVEQLALALAGDLTRNSADQENTRLADWHDMDPAGLGDHATMYGFRAGALDSNDLPADGVLVMFARGTMVAGLLVMGTDGRTILDARQYARLVEARIEPALTAEVYRS
jgi:hypothetical protein